MQKTNWLFYAYLFLAGVFIYSAVVLNNAFSAQYLWLLLPGCVFGVLGYFEYKRVERKKLLFRLRRAWGKPVRDRERSFTELAYLFEKAGKSPDSYDERTWHDLNMDLVFAELDRTMTWPGAQRLYQMLRTPEAKAPAILTGRNRMVLNFQQDQKLREDIQVKLSTMDRRFGSGLSILLWGDQKVVAPHPRWLYTLMALLAPLSTILLFFGMRNIILVLIVFQVNMYLHFAVQKKIRSYFEGVRSLGQLVRVGKQLSSSHHDGLNELLGKVKLACGKVKDLNRIVQSVGVESSDPLFNVGLQYYAIFFLAEVRGFFRALEFIEKNRGALQELFLVVGEIDALQSVASYRNSLPYYCVPEIAKSRLLKLEEAYHPLLAEPVSNSVVLEDKGILVTGSNMSGKSTFLRTVGLNVLLGQTIATCPAQKYEVCPVQLFTCIGRSDNVVEGKSYYLEEALGVKRILDSLDSSVATLAIFDEMFRGTNSEERIFAAERVLTYLISRQAMVLVATHDLELTTLLNHRYRSVHFSEKVGAHGLEFDYKLKQGPTTTKNAIALLRYLEYPAEITEVLN